MQDPYYLNLSKLTDMSFSFQTYLNPTKSFIDFEEFGMVRKYAGLLVFTAENDAISFVFLWIGFLRR